MKNKKLTQSFSNGVPELLILRLISAREMYGYELVKAIQSSTHGTFAFAEGCVYPLLHSLEEKGLLKSRRKEVNGKSRLYYGITDAGERKLEKMLLEWDRVKAGIDLALRPQTGHA